MSAPPLTPPRNNIADYPYRLKALELAAKIADEGEDYYDLDELLKAADKIHQYLVNGELPRVQDAV